MGKIPVGLQLYTVRTDTAQDYAGTVKKVAQMGYAGVEFAGYGGLSAAEMKKLLGETNLKPAGTHTGLEAIEQDINAVMDYNREIGNKNIIVPSLAGERRTDRNSWLATAEAINKVGAELNRNGFTLGYHNHAFEFVKFGDDCAYDLFIGATDPELVKVQLDTYWVKHAELDPVEYIKKYSNRILSLHLKEMADNPEKTDTEVGNGILDWNAIFAAAVNSTCEWYVVEQEHFPNKQPLDCARINIENLKKMGIV